MHHNMFWIYCQIWSNGRDLNTRFYGFAIRCIGPLCHRCINALRPSAVIIEHWVIVSPLHTATYTPSTRFPTGTVLVLLTPVRLDRTYIHVLSWLLCETFPFQNHPCVSSHFSSSGSDYPVTLERLGGLAP